MKYFQASKILVFKFSPIMKTLMSPEPQLPVTITVEDTMSQLKSILTAKKTSGITIITTPSNIFMLRKEGILVELA